MMTWLCRGAGRVWVGTAPGYLGRMSNVFVDESIDVVAPGDIITVDRGAGPRPYKVVHKNDVHDNGAPKNDGADALLVTLEGADGELFEQGFAAGTTVTRSLESKWESAQSPTPHS